MNYCSETPQQQEPLTCQQVKSIKLGMTPNQVESLLGPPAGQDVKTGVTHWFYDTEQGSWVIKIREGKVVDSQNLLGGC